MKKFSTLKSELKQDALYRFVPFQQNPLKSLINSNLYFSDPHYQNDPVDSHYILDLGSVPDYYSGMYWRKNQKEQFIHFRVKFKIDYALKNDYGICCFSKSYNAVLLWTHYADAGRGFCFIFDKKALVTSLKAQNESMVINEVNYQKIPIIKPEFINREMIVNYFNIITSKNRPWKYEREVRIICNWEKVSSIDKKRIYNYDPKSLRGIILGERMQEEETKTIEKILQIPHFSHISLYKKVRSYENPRSYSFKLLQ
jgi:hypothetical protein